MTTLFLSYARSDDEPFVERLYESLKAHGFDIWWDRVSMPARALTFLQEIRDAIVERNRLVLVVGPGTVASDYVSAEWRCALEIGKAINPVLRLGDYDLLPEELKLLDAPDFRVDTDFDARLATLVRQLSEPVAPMGKLVGVPSLPPHFLRRPDRLRALKDAVLADLLRPVVVTGTAAKTGIHGMGGIGKSVLASTLGHDHEVRRAFPDGIVWVPVGQNPSVTTLQQEVAEALGDTGPFDTVAQGKDRLCALLADKAVLLVLDDVWEREHAEAFDVLGPRCRATITTRDASLITALGTTEHQLQLLTESEALALLADWADLAGEDLPPVAREVIAECGRLPLALAICGAMVRDGTPWEDLAEALRETDLEFLEHAHRSVLKSIKVSVDALSAEQRSHFARLAVFPPDETVPEDAVVTLWSHAGKTKEYRARKLLTMLERRALVRLDAGTPLPGGGNPRRVSLHDLLHDYASQLGGDAAALHGELLAAYQALCPQGWSTGPNDGYFFSHLRRHLAGAGRGEELVALSLDFDWLEAKAAAKLTFDLPSDFREARRFAPPEDTRRRMLDLLEEALQRDMQFIARHPPALFQCLWNTCWWYDSPEAAAHYVSPPEGWPAGSPPWEQPGPKLSQRLQAWRQRREEEERHVCWIRAIRPPATPLGSALRAVLTGHASGVTAVAYSHDGRFVASGSGGRITGHAEDFTVRVWDVSSGTPLNVLPGHQSPVTGLAFCHTSGSAEHLVSSSLDRTIRVWDTEGEGRLLHTLHDEDAVQGVACPAEGRYIASCSGRNDPRVQLWDAVTGAERKRLAGPNSMICSLACSRNGRHVAGGAEDGTLWVWDAQSGDAVATLSGHAGAVLGLAFCPDPQASWHIATAGADGTVRLWSLDQQCELSHFLAHEEAVCCVGWTGSPPGPLRLASGSEDGTVRVWDPATGDQLRCLRGQEDVVSCVASSPDGRHIVSGGMWDRRVRIWMVEEDAPAQRLRGHTGWIRSVAVSRKTRQVASGSEDQTVCVWDAETGGELHCCRGHRDRVTCLAYFPDGRRLVSGSEDETLRVWDTQSGAELVRIHDPLGEVAHVLALPDGHGVVGCSGDLQTVLQAWDIRSRQRRWRMDGHELPITGMASSRDGRHIVTTSEDRTVRVWNVNDAAEVCCLRGHEGTVWRAVFLPDGRRVASVSEDETVRIWDVSSGAELHRLAGHEKVVRSLACSADGRTIASTSDDATVRVWDADQGSCSRVIDGRADPGAVTAGGAFSDWLAVTRGLDMAVHRNADGRVVAWFPTGQAAMHFDRRTWVLCHGSQLVLLTLEGASRETGTAPEGT